MTSYNGSGNSEDGNRLFTATQIAEWLHVSVKTVYRYLSKGTIPGGMHVGVGQGGVRIGERDFQAYLASRRQGVGETVAPAAQSPSPDSVPHETLAYRVEQAAAMLNVGKDDIGQAIRQGQLYAVIVGETTVIPKGELEQLIEAPAKIDKFTRQLLIQKGIISEGYPFDTPVLYMERKDEIASVAAYVLARVSEIRRDYNLGLALSLDEILQHVGKEIMEGRYAQPAAAPRKARRVKRTDVQAQPPAESST